MLRINNRCHQCGKPWASYDVKIECPYDRDGDREVVIRHLCNDCGRAYVKALDAPQDRLLPPAIPEIFQTPDVLRNVPRYEPQVEGRRKRGWWLW